MKETNSLLESACHNEAVPAKYYFRAKTGKIKWFSGLKKNIHQPLTVLCLECWKMHMVSLYSAMNSSLKNLIIQLIKENY